MLCEKCKKRTATVFYNENMNGKTRSFSLCGECAAKLREKGDLQDITSMLDSFADPFSELHENLFHGFFGVPTQKAGSAGKKCPSCGSAYQEIASNGKVGCPICYEAFREELSRLIGSIHGTTSHQGRIPSRHRARKERDKLLKEKKQALAEAVEKEDYERAALLRDEVRKLETGKEKA